MIVSATLIVLVFLCIFSVVLGNSFFGIIVEQTIDNSVIVNGSTTSFVVESTELIIVIDPITGMIANIITWTSIALIIGIRVLGSGLSDASVRIGTLAIIYTSIWTLLSTLAYPLIASIDVFGALIYVVLTIGYTVGVIQKIAGGSSGD